MESEAKPFELFLMAAGAFIWLKLFHPPTEKNLNGFIFFHPCFMLSQNEWDNIDGGYGFRITIKKEKSCLMTLFLYAAASAFFSVEFLFNPGY